MTTWQRQLGNELAELAGGHLLRRLRSVEPAGRFVNLDGENLLNLAGNDYLALSGHPRLRQAAIRAIERWGVGSGASRLLSGTWPIHQQVEQRFARFKQAEAALLLPSGYMANLAVLSALAGSGDLICLDKLSHASLLDAAHASGAQVRVYSHGGLEKLRRLLHRHRDLRRRFIVTDSVFSMDGDVADLPALCDLAEEHDAILVVDEAHGTGVLGEHGGGLGEWAGVSPRVPIVVSTASKALGGLGGLVTASQVVIDTLVNKARPLIYSTAVPPAQAAVIDAALDLIESEPWRRRRLQELSKRVRQIVVETHVFENKTFIKHAATEPATPIVPLVVGTAQAALNLSAHLRHQGLFAPAIRPPTVAPAAARVRLSLRADLEDEDLHRLREALASWRT